MGGRPMLFALPKPPNGWRDFAWEIAIVFTGVVLALVGERLIQQFNWRQDARQATAAIKAELAEHRLAALERLAVQPCLRGQILALHKKLSVHRSGMWTGIPMLVNERAAAAAQRRSVSPAYRSPEPPWVDEAWQLARSTGALNHLPAADIARYAQVYRRSSRFLVIQDQEGDAAARLSVLAVDGPIDASSRIELLGAVARIDHANAYMELAAKQQVELLRPLLSDLPKAEVDRAIAERVAGQRAFRGPCVQVLKLTKS
jgi:hypothetical protein